MLIETPPCVLHLANLAWIIQMDRVSVSLVTMETNVTVFVLEALTPHVVTMVFANQLVHASVDGIGMEVLTVRPVPLVVQVICWDLTAVYWIQHHCHRPPRRLVQHQVMDFT